MWWGYNVNLVTGPLLRQFGPSTQNYYVVYFKNVDAQVRESE